MQNTRLCLHGSHVRGTPSRRRPYVRSVRPCFCSGEGKGEGWGRTAASRQFQESCRSRFVAAPREKGKALVGYPKDFIFSCVLLCLIAFLFFYFFILLPVWFCPFVWGIGEFRYVRRRQNCQKVWGKSPASVLMFERTFSASLWKKGEKSHPLLGKADSLR